MRNLGLSALAAVALLLPACSSGGETTSGAFGNAMFILTCNLGCASGANGQELLCTGLTIAPNQEFVVTFSQPIDPDSVTSESFNIIAPGSGASPLGTRLVDPADPRRVIFRPAVTFDAQGGTSFGFTPNTSYTIHINGTAQDATGPYIRSTSGKPNASRMSCPMATNAVPADYVFGNPSVAVFVDVVKDPPVPADPIAFNQPADGQVGVWNQSTVRLVFDDIMNPLTLANQVTHQATLTTILVDVDGDLATTTDQVTLAGSYVVAIDLANIRTTMTFTANSGMPSSGDPALNPLPRRVVVNFPAGIQDLVGNSLSNPGSVSFVPERIVLPEVPLTENFSGTANEQVNISCGTWGSGRLARGFGGGSGRLGQLTIRQGAAVDLSTDSQVFPLDPVVYTSAQVVRDVLDNSIPNVSPPTYVPTNPSTWPTITVTDGLFEFSSLTLLTGATLRFHGNNPARVIVRGPVEIQGNAMLNVSGSSAPARLSDAASGGPGGLGGPHAGTGGRGGDRYDQTDAGLRAAGGILNPGAVYNGARGGGVGQVAGVGSARGGQFFPQSNLPTSTEPPVSVAGGLSWTFDFVHFEWQGCQSLQPGCPGGGATYGDGTNVVGGPGIPNTPTLLDEDGNSNLPASTRPGPGIVIEPPDPESGHLVRTLDADLGYLRGGSGGGGGGLSLFGTQTSNDFVPPCGGSDYVIPVNVPPAQPGWQDNSACGGGGGGGAVQIVSGSSILLDGVIDARGGNGGSADVNGSTSRVRQGAPGGGGAGGAVRLQAPFVALAPVSGRIIVIGGSGGVTDMNHLGGSEISNSIGGSGSSGLVRIEDSTGLLTRALEAPWILPFDPLLPESKDFVSVGNWVQPSKRPEGYTGSSSCWMQPTDPFFLLNFLPDDLGNPTPSLRFGWNMDVVYDSGGGEQLIHYRGPDPLSPFFPSDFEQGMGNTLNHGQPNGVGSVFAIRFQGAKSTSRIAGRNCDLRLVGLASDIVAGSLTPWVQHPQDLNAFNPRPDMVRFCVVFDASLVTPASLGSFIKGVTNVSIRTQPD